MRKMPLVLVIVGIMAVVCMVLMAIGRARQREMEAWEADTADSGA